MTHDRYAVRKLMAEEALAKRAAAMDAKLDLILDHLGLEPPPAESGDPVDGPTPPHGTLAAGLDQSDPYSGPARDHVRAQFPDLPKPAPPKPPEAPAPKAAPEGPPADEDHPPRAVKKGHK